VNALGGNCQTPIGAYAKVSEGGELELVAVVVSPDGARLIRAARQGDARDADSIGRDAGRQLIAEGASEILGN